MQHSHYGVHTHPVEVVVLEVVLEVVSEGSTAHAYRCGTIFVLLSVSVFMNTTGQKTYLTISITSPTSNFLPTRCCHEVYILLGPCVSCVQVWVSSVTEITPDDLRAQDMDSPPEDLRYMVTPPSNGHLALKSAPMQAVYNFTQKYIDQGQLLFVHKGKICVFNHVKKVKKKSDFFITFCKHSKR